MRGKGFVLLSICKIDGVVEGGYWMRLRTWAGCFGGGVLGISVNVVGARSPDLGGCCWGRGVRRLGGWELRVVLGVAKLGHFLECRIAKGDLGYWVLLFGGSDGLRE